MYRPQAADDAKTEALSAEQSPPRHAGNAAAPAVHPAAWQCPQLWSVELCLMWMSMWAAAQAWATPLDAECLCVQDWDSLFGHLAPPAPDPPKPAPPSAADASAASPIPEPSSATAGAAVAETARLVDLDGPNSKEHTDHLFWEADLDEDGR